MEFNDNTDLRRQFARRLKEKMREHDMSIGELARQINTTKARVSPWTSGAVLPNLTAARQLAMLFNVSLDYFACVPFNKKKDNETILCATGR